MNKLAIYHADISKLVNHYLLLFGLIIGYLDMIKNETIS